MVDAAGFVNLDAGKFDVLGGVIFKDCSILDVSCSFCIGDTVDFVDSLVASSAFLLLADVDGALFDDE